MLDIKIVALTIIGMALSTVTGTGTCNCMSRVETPLLDDVFLDRVVDYKGSPVNRFRSGSWKSACFIIGVEIAERFAYTGIVSNLITYLTGTLGQSTATAAEKVNAWDITVHLLPLFSAFIADSYLGQFQTIIISSLLYTATGTGASASTGGEERPLLAYNAVDYHGRSVNQSKSGGWKSAYFIIGRLGQSTAAAAANMNLWHGTSLVLPLLGAFIADSYLGQYRSIIISSLRYILVSQQSFAFT